jgi:hypothetical protein
VWKLAVKAYFQPIKALFSGRKMRLYIVNAQNTQDNFHYLQMFFARNRAEAEQMSRATHCNPDRYIYEIDVREIKPGEAFEMEGDCPNCRTDLFA